MAPQAKKAATMRVPHLVGVSFELK